jgi:transcriptional regulator with XRE-family HTH domain
MFAQRIKQLRADKNINQIQLAQEMGVSQGTVGKWETERRLPDADMLRKLGNYFDVSTDYLLGRENDDLVLLSRDLKNIPDEDRRLLINNFQSTIHIYLKSKGR